MTRDPRIYQLKIRVNRKEYLALLLIAERFNLGRNGSTSCAAAALAASAFARLRIEAVLDALNALKPYQKAIFVGKKREIAEEK